MRKIYTPSRESGNTLIEHDIYFNSSDIYRYINKLSIAKGAEVRSLIFAEKNGRIYNEGICSKEYDACPGIVHHAFYMRSNSPVGDIVFSNEPEIVTDFVDCLETTYPNLDKWEHPLVEYLLSDYGEWSRKNNGKSIEEFLKERYNRIHPTMSFQPIEKYTELSEEIETFLKLFYLEKKREVTCSSLEELALKEYRKNSYNMPYHFREENLLECINNDFKQNLELAKSNEKVLALRNQTK